MENWAYGFSLNHEGAGVGTIYYSKKYFEREGIVNPANAEAYSAEEIFNTPGIIRFPFEQMTNQNEKWKLIRFNKEDMTFYDLGDRFIGITEDINEVIK